MFEYLNYKTHLSKNILKESHYFWRNIFELNTKTIMHLSSLSEAPPTQIHKCDTNIPSSISSPVTGRNTPLACDWQEYILCDSVQVSI